MEGIQSGNQESLWGSLHNISPNTSMMLQSLRPSPSWRAYQVKIKNLYESLFKTVHQTLVWWCSLWDHHSHGGRTKWKSRVSMKVSSQHSPNTSMMLQFLRPSPSWRAYKVKIKSLWESLHNISPNTSMMMQSLRPSPSWGAYKVKIKSLYESLFTTFHQTIV